jgi:hypothetical protein
MATKAENNPQPKPRRTHHKRKQSASSPLPPPLELPAPSSQPEPKPNGNGLFGNLNPFASPSRQSSPETFSTAPQSSPAGFSPETEPLSPEAEQILSQIPETIGGEADDPGGPADVGDHAGQLGGAGFDLAGEICDEEAAREILEWVGDSLADWRKREEYRVAGKRAGGAAKHWSRVINGLWTRYAPLLLSQLGETVPGLIPAVAMTAIAFAPAIGADIKQTALDRGRRGVAEPQGPQPVPPQRSTPRYGIVE